MGKLLFSPKGRISQLSFLKGFGLIVLLHALITMLGAFNLAASGALALLSLLLFYPVICLLIKRNHDGGKSGWVSIVWLILFIIIWFMVTSMAQNMTGGDILAEMKELTQAALEDGDLGAMLALAEEYAEPLAKKTSVATGAARFVGLMVAAFVMNLIIGADKGENQYGPVPVSV